MSKLLINHLQMKNLRLDCIEISQTAKSPQSGQKVMLDSIQQFAVEFGAIENGRNVTSAYQSHNDVTSSETKETAVPLKGKYRKKGSISLEILQEHLHLTLEDAASSLNVSKSTLKRRCRDLGILNWQSHKSNMLKPVGESVQNAGGGAYNPTLAMSPSLLPTVGVPHQPNSPCYKTAEGPRNLACSGLFPKRVKTNLAQVMQKVTAWKDVSIVIVKATYGEDVIRFRFPSTLGIVELKKEVKDRLKLKVGTFNIKYEDDNQERILMACDADLHECMHISTSLGNDVLRLFVHDKATNSRSLCESTREGKRKHYRI